LTRSGARKASEIVIFTFRAAAKSGDHRLIRVCTHSRADPALAEISWLLPKGPELASSAVPVPVSAETSDRLLAVLAELSLALQSCFPETTRFEGNSAASPSIWR
jgi:hypothetical protein